MGKPKAGDEQTMTGQYNELIQGRLRDIVLRGLH
jgi:hypothetical protein